MPESAALIEVNLPALQSDHVMSRVEDEFSLLRELNHRMANTLAVIGTMLQRELSRSHSFETRKSFERCEARVVALGNLHRFLLAVGSSDRIPIQGYIEQLCAALSEALLKPLGVRCEVACDDCDVEAERCERLGLVVTELVMNAAKHAFAGRTGGLLRITLIERPGSLVCVVSDNGVGRENSADGAGSKILNQLVHALDGTIIVESARTGTTVFVTFPRKDSA